MTIEKLPSVELGFRDDCAPPVLPLRMQVEAAICAAPHAHPRGQLVYASAGVMQVVSPEGRWVVPPGQAVWLPPLLQHEMSFPGQVTLHSLFFSPEWSSRMPNSCEVLAVSPLLHALVERAHEYGDSYPVGGMEWRLMQVLADEICCAPRSAIHLPSARDARLLRVMDQLAAVPSNAGSLEEHAARANCSPRTLARLFVHDTGLTFGQWRRRLLLQVALTRLANGESVTDVALDLGYRSLSAFIGMFRSELGCTPGYFRSG